MSSDPVRLELEGAIGSLFLDRPKTCNAMTEAMGEAVHQAVREVNRKKDVRALLVRGEGKVFCAGGDLRFLEERAKERPERNAEVMRAFYERFLAIRDVRVPTIAVIQGAAIGAGLCFALACDLRLAATGAKLGASFVRLGLHPGMGATFLLPRLVGPARASELLLTGRLVDADDALSMGMVNQVHRPQALLRAAEALAEEIASAAPLAVQHAKKSIYRGMERSIDKALEREAYVQAINYASNDVAEALRAVRERRDPVFRGR